MNEWMSEIVIELIHWIIELTRKGSQPCLGLLEKVLFRNYLIELTIYEWMNEWDCYWIDSLNCWIN